MSPQTTTPTCTHLRHPNAYTVTLAAIILVGILISYLPQHIKIIQRRSSEGLSPYWVLLGGVSSIAAIANILVLPSSRRDMACCEEVTGGECAAALLGVGQIGLQWGCFMFIVFLFLTFFPSATKSSAHLEIPPNDSTTPPKRRDALIVGITTLTTLLLVALASLVIVFRYPTPTSQNWADTLGTIAGTLAMIQWLPQIIHTYRMRSLASLSVITMIIQVPGAFMFAFSLWLRVGWEGWSAWLVFIVTGVLQSVLLGLAIYYYVADRRKVREEVQAEVDGGDERGDVDERTALLGNGRGGGKPGVEGGVDERSTLDRLLEGRTGQRESNGSGENET